MKKLLVLSLLALSCAFVSCKKEEPKDVLNFLMAKDLKTELPSVIEVSLARAGYVSDWAFVPALNGKPLPCNTKTHSIKFFYDNATSFVSSIAPYGAIYATDFGLEGEVYGFEASSTAKVGDSDNVTIVYDHDGYQILKRVKVKVVE